MRFKDFLLTLGGTWADFDILKHQTQPMEEMQMIFDVCCMDVGCIVATTVLRSIPRWDSRSHFN